MTYRYIMQRSIGESRRCAQRRSKPPSYREGLTRNSGPMGPRSFNQQGGERSLYTTWSRLEHCNIGFSPSSHRLKVKPPDAFRESSRLTQDSPSEIRTVQRDLRSVLEHWMTDHDPLATLPTRMPEFRLVMTRLLKPLDAERDKWRELETGHHE